MENKKKFYFVGNAHLDPVWMWRWQEGSCEAKATVRSALDRMKEHEDFKFVCSSASVYEWIEDFDEGMAEEIRGRVKEGRFIIVGGWYVQPDCNLPSGEGFVRHGLYCQRYFHEHFGTTASTGYNVDSFGHNGMLPQLLRKSGLRRYIFMRPGPHEKELPADVFLWRSPDGSEVPAYRIYDRYCHDLQDDTQLESVLDGIAAGLPEGCEGGMLFYGVGNHGGGPTKQNIRIIKESAEKHPEREYIFSDIEDYFKMLEAKGTSLPVVADDLQHHAPGCYAAVSLIKTLVRESENALLAAESLNMTAHRLVGKKPAGALLKDAWKNVLFCHFHDILGGCAMEDSYKDASHMLGESIAVASRVANSAVQTVSWRIDTRDASRGTPVVVFNPLPFAVEDIVVINKEAEGLTDENGAPVLLQHVQSQAHATFARSDTAFLARVPAMGYATYYITDKNAAEDGALSAWDTGLENEHLRVEFEKHTGYVTRIYDKDAGKELLSGKGAVPTVIDETGHDTWSHAKTFFTKKIALFSDAEICVVERGPVRVMLEVKSRYNASTLTQYFSLKKGGRTLDVTAEADWHERHKMLKIGFETATESPDAYYEIPFGVIRRPADGEEEPGYRFVAVKDEKGGAALINSNKYSFSAEGNTLYLTALRSPLYADHGRPANDRCRYTDQGVQAFSYAFLALEGDGWERVIKEGRRLNTPLVNVIENNHEGSLPTRYEGIFCDSGNVQISCVKRAEDGSGTVLRIYETDGKDGDVTIRGGVLPSPLSVHITPYSVDTYLLPDGEKEWKEVLLTEFDS